MDTSKAAQHKNRREDWITPVHIIDPIHKIQHFSIDFAASKHNRQCVQYIGPDHRLKWRRDFLKLRGLADIKQKLGGHHAWINPPYGRNLESFTYALRELHCLNIRNFEVTALLPASLDVGWFHENVFGYADLYTREGRIQFKEPPGYVKPICKKCRKAGVTKAANCPHKSGNTGGSLLCHYWNGITPTGGCRVRQLEEVGWDLLNSAPKQQC